MLHTSTRKLIDRLAEMTELGKLDWVDSDDGNVAYATEGYSVTLTESPNEVIITSKDGKELERATAEEIAATEAEDGTSYTAIVAAMTKEAARVARGTETAISTLLAGMEDAPAEAADPDEIAADSAEALQEDLGDDTSVLAEDPVEPVSNAVETNEIEAQEDEVAAATTEPADETQTEHDASSVSDTPEIAEEQDTPPLSSAAIEATESTDDTERETEDTSETETGFAPAAPFSFNASSEAEPEPASGTETEPEADIDLETQTEDSHEQDTHEEDTGAATFATDARDDAVETASEDEVEEVVVETTAETDVEADSQTESVLTESESDSETEVTEAVVRLAREVKDREDTGLETAAASAVGAVALAAGLTLADDTEAETQEEDTVTPEPAVEMQAEETIEAETPPAYVPFGLTDTSDDPVVEEESAPAVFAATEPEPEVETEVTEVAPFETTTAPETVSPSFAAAVTQESEAEPEAEAEPEFSIDATEAPEIEPSVAEETPVREAFENPFVSASQDDVSEPVEASQTAPFTASPEPEIDTASEPETSFEAPTPTEPEPAEPEPVLASAATTESQPEAEPKESYSLSGIGAGFGLGALAAKTEASGIPGPSSAPADPSERVIIDATDDVLPKLEGNLNTALAETASAAVSNAKLEPVAAESAEEPAEAESDILKPRTRFNPWD